MPRDGSNIYHRPPGTDGVPNYTVESARYNAFTADVEQDLNLPRPVIAGGTGANNAADAMTNLGGELSAQLIVNYNSDPFQAGSFYSAAGATGAPSVNAFTGICYSAVITGSVTTDLFIEARDQVTTNLWVRQKKANVWQPWAQAAGVTTGPSVPTSVSPNTLWWDPTRGKLFIYYQDADSSQWVEAVAVPDVDVNTFVEIAGDNMTGPLILSADPTVALQAATKQYVDAAKASVARGQCRLVKSGANLVLMPFGGNQLTINGVNCTIPGVGVTLAPTGLLAATTYYIYAVATAGAVTSLEASTTGHSTDVSGSVNTGVEIKTGDVMRSLVGMAYVDVGPAFTDTLTRRYVRSWFNRVTMTMRGSTRGASTGITGTVADLGSVMWCGFVCFADDAVQFTSYVMYFSTVAGTVSFYLGYDLVASGNPVVANTDSTGRVYQGAVGDNTNFSENVHAVGLMGSASGTCSLYSASYITGTVG